jgi:hypothetical protein
MRLCLTFHKPFLADPSRRAYFMTILGIWNILGALVILVPGFALVKEWA